MFVALCLPCFFRLLLAQECSPFGTSSYPNEESFIQMVIDNITASNNYIFPVNNERLVFVSDTEKNKRHDYGTFDFVIVGGGAAGTVLANRLSEIEEWKVLLLEAGGPENDFSDIPAMDLEITYSEMNWGYNTTPQTTSCLVKWGRMCEFHRGKVLGGSSTINAKFYARGHPENYNNWARMGNEGWSFEEVLPYFIKSENSHVKGDLGYHGRGGYLDVNHTEPTIFTTAYLNAMRELGYEIVDYNGRRQIGASRIQFTIKGNKVASGGRAFLQPVICRRNLKVAVNAFVTRLLINKHEKTAYGVEFIKDGRIYTVLASKEVILSAGSVNTPQILMISGIGPKEELDRIQVETIVDLPAVGRHMEDHAFFTGINVRTNVTLFNDSLPVLVDAYLRGHRPFTAPANIDATAFLNVNDRSNSNPDIQVITFVPPGVERIRHINTSYVQQKVSRYSDMLLGIVFLRPKSRGSIRLQSKSPVDFPLVDYNFYSDPEGEDIDTMYKGILETLRLLDTSSFKSINASYVSYLRVCTDYPEGSKEYWYCAIKYVTNTIYHPVGTTRMGTSVRNSVVSPRLEVHGMKGLRIIDAGVMPEIPASNTMAPTYMIAEKAADYIKGRYGFL